MFRSTRVKESPGFSGHRNTTLPFGACTSGPSQMAILVLSTPADTGS